MTLCLDLGTKTGWAIRVSGVVASGTNDLKPGRFDGGGMRYLRFLGWLSSMKTKHGMTAVAFEEVRRHAGTDAAHVYGGLMAMLTSYCEEHDIPYQGIPVGTIKKSATGKGNAGKSEVIAAMQRAGFAPKDDNEADALALLLCVEQMERQ